LANDAELESSCAPLPAALIMRRFVL